MAKRDWAIMLGICFVGGCCIMYAGLRLMDYFGIR